MIVSKYNALLKQIVLREDVVGLVDEIGFKPSSELSSTDGC